MPIRVVHSVYRWLEQTETWLYNQVRFLPPDIEAHIVTDDVTNVDQFPAQHIHAATSLSWPRRAWGRALRRLRIRRHMGHLLPTIQAQGASVVHSHFGPLGWENVRALRQSEARHIVTFYGMDVQYLPQSRPHWYNRYGELFETVDRVLCEGPHMAASVVALGCSRDKVLVHHLGVPVDEIPFSPRRWRRGSPLRVLMAASFREKKGIPYGVEALGALARDVPLEVTIIGDASHQPRCRNEKKRILEALDRFGLRSKTRLLGYQPHRRLMDEAATHHVFLAPSVTASDGDTEGGAPVCLIEMIASGMPIVSTRHCDIPAVVRDAQTGFLAEERDVEGLTERLHHLVREADSWEDFLRAGRRHVESEFDARTQGKRLAKIYRNVAGMAPEEPYHEEHEDIPHAMTS